MSAAIAPLLDAAALFAALDEHARRTPHGVAVRRYDGAAWAPTGWAELAGNVRAVAAGTGHLGEGPPVVLVVENSAAGFAVLLGLLAGGADVLCVEPGNSHLADPRSVVHRGTGGSIVVPRPPGSSLGFRTVLTYRDLLGASARTARAAPAGVDGPAVYQLTSGSTGEPKAARQPLRHIAIGAGIYRDRYGYTGGDRVLLPVPVAHSFGLVGGLAAALLAGAEVVVLDRLRLTAVHAALAAGASVLLGTPLLYRMLGASTAALPPPARPRVALSSGGPVSRDAATTRLGLPLHQVYGSTETGIIASQYDRPEPWPPGTVGTAAPGVSWRLAPGDGRLWVRTATLFTGYLGHPGPPPSPNGEYDTGDIARTDPAGHLYLTARKEAFVNVGGRKVSPTRVERLLASHPGVGEAYVYAATRPDGEQVVCAAVVPTGADTCDRAGLLAHCRTVLAPHEVPHRLYLVPRLPRSALGKVDVAAVAALDTGSDGASW